MKKKAITWAFVGLGRQAERFAEAMSKTQGQRLVAIVGDSKTRTAGFAKRYKVSHRFSSLKVLLTSDKKKHLIDAVYIASPNNMHARESLQAIRAGKDVLCEKPLALSIREGENIVREAKKGRVHFLVDFQLRQNPAIQEARKMIAQEKLGVLVYMDMHWSIGTLGQSALPKLPTHMQWREDLKRSGGGAVMARRVHLFDLVRFLIGQEITAVRSFTDASAHSVDRTAVGILELEKGTPALITTSKQIPSADNRIVIYGSKGKLTLGIFDGGAHTLEFTTARGTRKTKFYARDLYGKVLQDFANAREKKAFVGATADDGKAVIAITEAFIASAKKARAVSVSFRN